MNKAINIFYVDRPISSLLDALRSNKDDLTVNRAGDSIYVTIDRNGEHRNLSFRSDDTFTYDVNGHYFGTFAYDRDKIIAKWPQRFEPQQQKKIIHELQSIIREELS